MCSRGFYVDEAARCNACPSYTNSYLGIGSTSMLVPMWWALGAAVLALLIAAWTLWRSRLCRFSMARLKKRVLPLFKNRLAYITLYSSLNDILLLNNTTSIELPTIFRTWYLGITGFVLSANLNIATPECLVDNWDMNKTFLISLAFSCVVMFLCYSVGKRFAFSTAIPFLLRQLMQQSMRVFAYTTNTNDGVKRLSYAPTILWLYNNSEHAAVFALGLAATVVCGIWWFNDMRGSGFGVWPEGSVTLKRYLGDSVKEKNETHLCDWLSGWRWLLQSDDDGTERSSDSLTPLMAAVILGQREKVEELLLRAKTLGTRRDLLDAQTSTGMTALMFACISGRLDIVDLLLGCSASKDSSRLTYKRELQPNLNIKTDDIGMNALMWAALKGHADIVGRLEGARKEAIIVPSALRFAMLRVQTVFNFLLCIERERGTLDFQCNALDFAVMRREDARKLAVAHEKGALQVSLPEECSAGTCKPRVDYDEVVRILESDLTALPLLSNPLCCSAPAKPENAYPSQLVPLALQVAAASSSTLLPKALVISCLPPMPTDPAEKLKTREQELHDNWDVLDNSASHFATRLEAFKGTTQLASAFAILYGPGPAAGFQAAVHRAGLHSLNIVAFAVLFYLTPSSRQHMLALDTACCLGGMLVALTTSALGVYCTAQGLEAKCATNVNMGVALIAMNAAVLFFVLLLACRVICEGRYLGKGMITELPPPQPPNDWRLRPVFHHEALSMRICKGNCKAASSSGSSGVGSSSGSEAIGVGSASCSVSGEAGTQTAGSSASGQGKGAAGPQTAELSSTAPAPARELGMGALSVREPEPAPGPPLPHDARPERKGSGIGEDILPSEGLYAAP